jgi:Na+-transporting methylmalonyl-CoA/oxaloacetate decarboxylase gamma subunit
MRQLRPLVLLLLACVLALIGAIAASAGEPAAPAPTVPTTAPPPPEGSELSAKDVQAVIDGYRHRTWRWQRVMSRPVTLTLQRPPANPTVRIRVWKQIAARTQALAQHPPHARAWACIHRLEGSWTDPNAPYYGGLQMDLGFQRTYGRHLLARKGTADHWTPLEQMWVAERALRAGRGFFQWPNTARYCGLL